MKRIIVVLYLVVLSIVSCEKVDVAPPIEPTEYCWTCVTGLTTQVSWMDQGHARLGYPTYSTYTRTLCDMTEEDALIYELSATDSTNVFDGIVYVTVIKQTVCEKDSI